MPSAEDEPSSPRGDENGRGPEAPPVPPSPPSVSDGEDGGFHIDSGVGVGMSILPADGTLGAEPDGEGQRGGETRGGEIEEGRGGESGTESDGGGAFNDNRPSSSANEQQGRPRPTPDRSYTQRQMENIQDYRDVEETGKWGALSKRDIIAVSIVVLLAIVGTIVAVVVATRGGDDEEPTGEPTSAPTGPSVPPTMQPTSSPTMLPTPAPSTLDSRFSKGFTKLKSIDSGNHLPDNYTSLEGKHDDESETPQVRAASWSLYVDLGTAVDSIPFVERYVLAVLYHSTSGADWTDRSLWLNATASSCDWHGVECQEADRGGDVTIVELYLRENNVSGTNPLPFELTELKSLKNLNLGKNKLKGTIQGNIFETMHDHLVFLYLEYNELEGSLPFFIKETSVLDIFNLQGNSVSGVVNDAWCTHFEKGCEDRCLRKFSLECDNFDCTCCVASDGVECF